MKLATYVRKLKDRSGNYVVPATRSTGVYLSDNQTLQKWIDNMEDKKFDLLTVYPVGAIFQSTTDTSPASLFGGSWEKIQDRFLLGSSSSHSVTSTGGEENHTLTTSEMPHHNHMFTNFFGVNWGSSGLDVTLVASLNSNEYGVSAKAGQHGSNPFGVDVDQYNKTTHSGSDQPHNNMPPFYTVNIWRRTA